VGISSIKSWNNLRSNNLRVGQYLTIYPRKSVSLTETAKEKSTSSNAAKSYTVKRGDSLWSISRKFPGITVQNLKSWNGISDSNLKPGMVLKLSRELTRRFNNSFMKNILFSLFLFPFILGL
jgi:membrane-bound lytic murein transglycosylase D